MTFRRSFTTVVGLLVSLVALWIVVGTVDVGETVRVLARAEVMPLLGIVAIVFVQVGIRSYRWSFLLPTASRVTVRRLIPPLLVGYLGNAVLPARLGEPMRALLVARRERVGTTEALGSVLVERVVDVATLALVAFLASTLVEAPAWATQALGVSAALGIIAIVVLTTVGLQPLVGIAERIGLNRRSALRDLVHRFASTLGGHSRRRSVLVAAAISMLAWLLDAGSFWLASQAVGADIEYAAALFIAGVTVLSTAIPSAPGYVGTFELAAAGMAVALGLPAAEALAMAVVAHVMTLGPTALGGAASMIMMGGHFGEVAQSARSSRHA